MEKWKDIPGYEGLYKVSSSGKVMSYPNRASKHFSMLKPRTSKFGYLRVCLSKNGIEKDFYVHRLVAITFLGNMSGLEVNHIDGDKSNNAIDNLEWCSRTENNIHKLYCLGRGRIRAIKCLDTGKKYSSITNAAKDIGCSTSEISRAIKRGYNCRGFRFKYI